MEKQNRKITYTQRKLYFEVKFMEGILFSCREYLEMYAHLHFLKLSVSGYI